VQRRHPERCVQRRHPERSEVSPYFVVAYLPLLVFCGCLFYVAVCLGSCLFPVACFTSLLAFVVAFFLLLFVLRRHPERSEGPLYFVVARFT
jgi:hypothetical protein